MKRFIELIQGLLPFFAAVFIQSLVFSAILAGYAFSTGNDTMPPGAGYYIQVIAVLICGLIFFYWYTRGLSFRWKHNSRNMFSAERLQVLIILGIGSQFAISGTMSLIRPLFEETFEKYGQVVQSILGSDVVIVLLYVIIIAPVVEEMIFRGVMLSKLQIALPFLGANLTQAAIFGIYHWNIVQGLYAFGIGLILGYVGHRYQSLAASIILHIAINASSFFVVFIPGSKLAYFIAMILGIATIIWALLNITKNTESLINE